MSIPLPRSRNPIVYPDTDRISVGAVDDSEEGVRWRLEFKDLVQRWEHAHQLCSAFSRIILRRLRQPIGCPRLRGTLGCVSDLSLSTERDVRSNSTLME